MASLPMRGQPSGPNAESPRCETSQESIFILRMTQDLVLPLRLPTGWAQESAPGTPTGFNATTQLTDPQSRRSHKIHLSVQPGFEGDTAKALLISDSIPREGTWGASLYEGDALRASIPFDKFQVELDRAMGPGVYAIELENSRVPVSRFALEIGMFSLPEALEYAPLFISRGQYIRAQSVLADAAARYPENADIEDLQMLAATFAEMDPAALRAEESQFGVTRSKGGTARSLRQTLALAKAKCGERLAWMFASRSLNRTTIPDEVIKKIAQETASIVVVEVLSVLEKRLEQQGVRDELMLEAMDGVNKRLDRIEDLYRNLNSQIELVRLDDSKSDDKKFEEVKKALEGFGEELAKRHLRIADYSQFFTQALGKNCWNWLSDDVRKIFMESEDHYRHALSRPLGDNPDFTAGLLDLYRGLELLFNERLGAVSTEIARTILGRSQILVVIGQGLPSPMRRTLRSNLEEIPKKSAEEKALSMFDIITQLHYGKSAKSELTDHAREIVGRSPGPADNEQLAILNLITAEYRNDKMHLHPKSVDKFTSREEMRALRKLAFGIDDGLPKVSAKVVQDGIERTSWLSRRETDEVIRNLPQRWGKFSGVVRVLWQSFGSSTKTTAA